MTSSPQKPAKRGRWLALLALCALPLAACGKTGTASGSGAQTVSGAGSSATSPAATPAAAVPPAEVESLIAAASQIKALPTHITPSLETAAGDQGSFLAQDRTGMVNGKKATCSPDWTQVQVPDCVWGDPNGTHTMVLLGDSHMEQWLSGFDQLGQRLHWKIILLAKPACGIPDTSFYDYGHKGPYPACDQWHTYSVQRVNQIDPAVVVMASDTYYPLDGSHSPISAATWTAGMVKTIQAITAPGVRKVVLGDNPVLGNPFPGEVAANCLSLHSSDIQACSTPTPIAIRAGLHQANQAGAQQGGASYIDTTSWFCSATCTAVVGNLLVYADAGHMTNEYAAFLSGELQNALAPYMQ